MTFIQPEKFYEACITYNLVNYFENIFEKKIYPFSISQIEEKIEGYDFGYNISTKSFFIQYKRPIKEVSSDLYSWRICREQLRIINAKNSKIYTYYALPNFASSKDWYEGLNKTYFISAPKLEAQLSKFKQGNKSNLINSNKVSLDKWNNISNKFMNHFDNLAANIEASSLTFAEILEYSTKLDSETKNCTWFYLLED